MVDSQQVEERLQKDSLEKYRHQCALLRSEEEHCADLKRENGIPSDVCIDCRKPIDPRRIEAARTRGAPPPVRCLKCQEKWEKSEEYRIKKGLPSGPRRSRRNRTIDHV